VVVARVEGGPFFANTDTVRDALRADASRPGTKAVVLDAETVPYVDVTAVRMLVELADTLQSSGVRLAIAHDVGQVRDLVGEEPGTTSIPVYPTVEAAVQALGG
jgi:sulfate permease, SulP family